MITMWGLFRTYRQADELIAAVAAQALAINALVPELALGLRSPAGVKPGLTPLLAGSLARQVAGIGGLLAAGPMARSLARAAAGDGMEEALLAAGLSPAYAGFYVHGLREGGVLLAVTIEDAHERGLVGQYRRAGVEFLAGLPAAFPASAAVAGPDAGRQPPANVPERRAQAKGSNRPPNSSGEAEDAPPGGRAITSPGAPDRLPGSDRQPGAKGRPAHPGDRGKRGQHRPVAGRGSGSPSQRDSAVRKPPQGRSKPSKTGG